MDLSKAKLLPDKGYDGHRTYEVRVTENATHVTRHYYHVRKASKDWDAREWKTVSRREKYPVVNGPLIGDKMTTDDARVAKHGYCLFNRSGEGAWKKMPKAVWVKM